MYLTCRPHRARSTTYVSFAHATVQTGILAFSIAVCDVIQTGSQIMVFSHGTLAGNNRACLRYPKQRR